ncbi:hypothetical protein CJU89_4900 [Yarrowia sp. B02]|nr:hypothetical protein CJU89_4900 [Yarrowia sp. B02]
MPSNNNIHKAKVLNKQPKVHNRNKGNSHVRRDGKGVELTNKLVTKKRAKKNSRNADYIASCLGEIDVEAIEAVGSRKRANIIGKISESVDVMTADDDEDDMVDENESKTQLKRRLAREELERISSTQNPIKLALSEDPCATEIAFQSGSKGTVLGAPLKA